MLSKPVLPTYRIYQQEADDAIYHELFTNDHSKCLVKMFCGTGKSLLMAKNRIHEGASLSLFVFPSLALITQFRNDYLNKISTNVLCVSSEDESTTDTTIICNWLTQSTETTKYVCVTYQSYDVLVGCLNDTETVADVAMYDEAHRAVGKTYQEYIFHVGEDRHVRKQIFLTATPKNDNGIVMYDRETPDSGMCGRLVYDYSYFRGMMEGTLNPFEIRLNFSTKNDNNDMYETIARAILTTGNNRVLTFHSDVETDRDYSVSNFTNEAEFKRAFQHICQTEFPEKVGHYKPTNIHMVALSASTSTRERTRIIGNLDASRDDWIYIICSCKTIGEGIDTKKANMCVFVDPKSSHVDIIQNIGRIVRLQSKPSTVLIPCWVDREKYVAFQDDPDARDELIRKDMQETGGNFNGILNVLSALKQEDEDLYDACLHYPSRFSPKEIKHNLESQGYKMIDPVDEDGDLMENLEYVLDEELEREEYEDCEDDEAVIQQVAEDKDICVEIHSDSLEQPVIRYNEDCESGQVVRLFRTTPTEEEMEEDDCCRYRPIVEKEGRKRNNDRSVKGPDSKKRLYVNVHNNDDVKVLWKVSGTGMLDGICNAIEADVIDIWEERLEETKTWMDENGKRPSCKSKDEKEKKLGRWVLNQRINYSKKSSCMKDINKRILWEQFLEQYKEYLYTFDDVWDKTLERLKEWIDENNKRPTQGSTNEDENKLAVWFSQNNIKYEKKRSKMNDINRYNKWTKFLETYGEYFKSPDDIWNDWFEELKTFIIKNEKCPSQKSKKKEESKLGHWLSMQQQHFKNKRSSMNNKERYRLWAAFLEEYKPYFKTEDDKWEEMFNETKLWINQHNKKPSENSKDKDEKRLKQWIGQQQDQYTKNIQGMKKTERRIKWKQFLEDYIELFKTKGEVWYDTLDELKNWIKLKNKAPSQGSSDENEQKLARWLTGQKQNYNQNKHGMIDLERRKCWENFLDEFKQHIKSDDEKWNETLEEVKEWIDKNKNAPSAGASNETEKSLGKWISHQITNYGQEKHGMKDIQKREIFKTFLEEHKEHFKTKNDIWCKHLEEVKEWIEKNKKKPSQTSYNQKEKSLGKWISQQQMYYTKKEKGMNDHKRVLIWETFINEYVEYMKSNDEIWIETLIELKEWIDENRKRPSQHSKNNTEKKLGRWICTNKKSQGLKNEERYNLWKQFLQDYSQYFNSTDEDDDDICSVSSTSTTSSSPKPKPQPKKKSSPKKSMDLPPTMPPPPKQKTPEEIAQEKEERKASERVFYKSEMSEFHKNYKTKNSKNLHQHFKENQEEFLLYHYISDQNENTYGDPLEIPRNYIISELEKNKHKKTKSLLDCGCGVEPKIRDHFKGDPRYEVRSFDHVSVMDNGVEECDISHLPIEDDSVDYVVLSLAMWGSNCQEYLQEAYRVLDSSGRLYIGEPTKRWTPELKEEGEKPRYAQRLIDMLEGCGFTIIDRDIKKFCLFTCVK